MKMGFKWAQIIHDCVSRMLYHYYHDYDDGDDDSVNDGDDDHGHDQDNHNDSHGDIWCFTGPI